LLAPDALRGAGRANGPVCAQGKKRSISCPSSGDVRVGGEGRHSVWRSARPGSTKANRSNRSGALAQLRMTDRRADVRARDTEIKLEKFSYAGEQDRTQFLMSVLKGGLRTIHWRDRAAESANATGSQRRR